MYHKSNGKTYINVILAFVLLLSYCSLTEGAEKNADFDKTRNGAVQIGEHWIGLVWPLAGAGIRSSAYGMRTDPFLGIEAAHYGIDIEAQFGADVLAALGGRVLRTGNGGTIGKFVVIAHSEERETIYGHLSEITVKEGQFVNVRKVIGKVGNSGRSTGAHLHFAVKKNGQFVDPQKWMVPTGLMKE